MMSITTKTVSSSMKGAKCISTWITLHQRSHYETLGVARAASQADIKSAFYRLSKKHHPDANVNDPTATAKFQEILEAYEVLGSEDSRKRYDVGMGPRIGTVQNRGFKTADDPRAAFYKSRLASKMNKPTTGRIYNFDDWTKQHYSESVRTNRVINNTSVTRNVNSRPPPRDRGTSTIESRVAAVMGLVVLAMVIALNADNPDSSR